GHADGLVRPGLAGAVERSLEDDAVDVQPLLADGDRAAVVAVADLDGVQFVEGILYDGGGGAVRQRNRLRGGRRGVRQTDVGVGERELERAVGGAGDTDALHFRLQRVAGSFQDERFAGDG